MEIIHNENDNFDHFKNGKHKEGDDLQSVPKRKKW